MHGKLEKFIKLNVYLNYTHLTVARLTGLHLSGQLVIYEKALITLPDLEFKHRKEPLWSLYASS